MHYSELTVQRIIERMEGAAQAPTAGQKVHEYPERLFREVHQGGHRIIDRCVWRTLKVITVVHFRQG